jgi:hypothetical protein
MITEKPLAAPAISVAIVVKLVGAAFGWITVAPVISVVAAGYVGRIVSASVSFVVPAIAAAG